ncbi:MAG: PAS domain S-box protein [Deltaproteobacteria bacterium]
MGEDDPRGTFGVEEEILGPSRTLDLRNGTETIDLHGLFPEPLTESGSFIVGLEASSLGKLLQAIPIPCLLLDQSLQVVFANEACEKLDPARSRVRGRDFSSLFKDPGSLKLARSTLKKVLSVRRRHVVECRIGRGNAEAWGRLNFRSLRVAEVRLVLLLVEDLTAERRQLLLTRKHQAELTKARDELRRRNEKLRSEIAERVSAEKQLMRVQGQLEMRVQERTTELRRINRQLRAEITVRKGVEHALRDSEQRFRAIFEDNHVVMILNDPETGEILDANPAACRFYGYERQELTGKTIAEISAELADQASREFQMAAAEECRFFYLKHRLGTGEVRDVEVCSGPITVNQKKVLYSIIYDVTERKRVEAELMRSRERLGLALDGADLGSWDWNLQTDAVVFNRRALEMLGHPLDDHKASIQSWEALLHPDDRDSVTVALRNHLDGQYELFEVEHRVCSPSGDWRWILVRGRVVERDAAGRPMRTAGTLLDITERKKAEGAVERARRMEALATMAAGIAHEVRNPLAVASSAVQLLSRDQVPGDIRQDLASKAVTGINRASEIIEQLLVLTRPVAEFHTSTLDVRTIVREAINVIQDEAIKREVDVFPDYSDGRLLVIGNTWLLRQALVNVFLKCLTGMPKGGILQVRAGKQGQNAAITIRHTASSLATEELDKMFEPFSEGTIGDRMRWELSLSYLIIRKHSGNIDVETGAEGSLTFTITLPDRSETTPDDS